MNEPIQYREYTIKQIAQSADGAGNHDYFISSEANPKGEVKNRTTVAKVKEYLAGKTIIEHFENGIQRFSNDVDFVRFCQLLFRENEGNDTTLKRPENYSDAIEYLRMYCDSFVVIAA